MNQKLIPFVVGLTMLITSSANAQFVSGVMTVTGAEMH